MEKSQLAKTLDELVIWRKNNKVHQSRCLEAVRWALARNGLRVPGPFPRPRNTAIECYRALSENPETYGWKRWTHADHAGEALPLCLAFFKDCGKLPDGRIAGHIAIYDPATQKHSANTLYTWNTSWSAKLVGAFVVDEGFARHPK
ncbi:MAG: hypothetical protein WCL39_12150 [Armatimonadota bacterium]